MKIKVVGIRKVDFTDNKSGDRITGHTIFGLKEDENVVGFEGKKFFIKNSIDISNVKVNDMVDVYFNEKGKVDTLNIINK